jgi:hypothetical protein
VSLTDRDAARAQQIAEERAYRRGYLRGALDAAHALVLDPLRAATDATLVAFANAA